MEPAGLLSLPLEVLHHIGKFLPVKDILTCSATCHYLRYALNDNNVWKKYLPQEFTSGLQNLDLCLQPTFCTEETLTTLCENRVNFMKKANLLNNWKSGTFAKHVTKLPNCYVSFSKTVGQVIYKDRYLFLGRFINNFLRETIEVWDINKEPVLLMDLKRNENYKYIYIVGDCLVVVECVQVKVYEIKLSEKALPLLFSFLITENDVVFNEPCNHPWRHDRRCVGWSSSMVDQYLFANQVEACVFHIWDILNACKVGSFYPPIMGCSITYEAHTGHKWLLHMYKQSGNESYYFQFDIERKSFSESVIIVNKVLFNSMFYDSCLILFEHSSFPVYDYDYYSDLDPELDDSHSGDCICSVYDINTSKKLEERCFEDIEWYHYSGIVSQKVINGQFVLHCNDGFHVIDALTLKTMQQFPYEGFIHTTQQLNIHGSVFILAKNTNIHTFEVWDLSKKEKVVSGVEEQVYASDFYLNASCTKLVVVSRYNISVYHFL